MRTFLPIALLMLLAGCAHDRTTDYHRADFSSRRAYKSHHSSGQELNEIDVLGVPASGTPTEADIRDALERTSHATLRPGAPVLLLQSGENVPDSRMAAEVNKHFRAIPFSGLRSDWSAASSTNAADHAAKSLRLAAAQAGAESILCFWGILEISRHELSTKTVTWLPVIDIFVPDQKEHVRCHLKVALVDVKTGAWSILRTEPVETEALTTGWSREHTDAPEIRNLKARSYEAAVLSLAKGH